MRRINTLKDTLNTGEAEFDAGDGVRFRIPLGRGVRVDQTAGRVVKIWDYLNKREQIIYGDTGWRKISDTEEIYVRRVGPQVMVQIYGNIGGTSGDYDAVTLPLGFRPKWHSDDTYVQGSVIKRVYLLTTGVIRLYSHTAGAFTSYSDVWFTSDAWPASLPGTASGDIPAG